MCFFCGIARHGARCCWRRRNDKDYNNSLKHAYRYRRSYSFIPEHSCGDAPPGSRGDSYDTAAITIILSQSSVLQPDKLALTARQGHENVCNTLRKVKKPHDSAFPHDAG